MYVEEFYEAIARLADLANLKPIKGLYKVCIYFIAE